MHAYATHMKKKKKKLSMCAISVHLAVIGTLNNIRSIENEKELEQHSKMSWDMKLSMGR